MYRTVNLTSVLKGQSSATVICDTIANNKRITTLELVYPRYIHSELMTHRCLTSDTLLCFTDSLGLYVKTLGEIWKQWKCDDSKVRNMKLRSWDEAENKPTYTKITDCWEVGVKPIYKLTAGNYSLKCTADHLILTDKGWTELQDIEVGVDSICCDTSNVIVNNIEPCGKDIVYDISVSSKYHNFFANGIIVHNCFSRNASSSRATPMSVLVNDVKNNPVFFDYIGVNRPGMVADTPLNEEDTKEFHQEWNKLANYVADWALLMQSKFNIHKQTINRVLEPFSRIRTLVTSTEWDNFFTLRLAPDAQPEMQNLARAMKETMDSSTPVQSNIHCPYIRFYNGKCEVPWVDTLEAYKQDAIKCSVARCARVSYGRLDARPDNIQDDIALYDKLWQSKHLSPFEHVAFAAGAGAYANFNGWKSLRYIKEHLHD